MQATDVNHKAKLLDALAWAPSEELIQRTLLYTLDTAVRSQDLAGVLVTVAERGGLGFDLTWKFIMEHADHIKERYPGTLGTFFVQHNKQLHSKWRACT